MKNIALYLDCKEALSELIDQLEPLQCRFQSSSSQHTQLQRRLAAFEVAVDLIGNATETSPQLLNYGQQELQDAKKSLSSTLKKAEKIPIKLKHNLLQQKRLLRQIAAFHLALELIEEAIQK